MEKIPRENDVKSYQYICHQLLSFIEEHTIFSDTRVYIEGYAFSKKASGNNYKLRELGGVFKYKMIDYRVFTVGISTWKKKVIGKGNATKQEIVKFVKNNGPRLDLVHIFGTGIVSPAHDLADASCIVLSSLIKKS